MTIVLRLAEPTDAARVADILIASRKVFLPFAPLAHSESDMREWVANTLVPSKCVTVAEAAGVVVGVLALSHSEGVSWIDQLYLAPPHVGRGIGSQLLAHAVKTMPAPMRLYTFQQNDGARRFYERHGFVAIELTDGSGNEERCPDVLYEWRGKR